MSDDASSSREDEERPEDEERDEDAREDEAPEPEPGSGPGAEGEGGAAEEGDEDEERRPISVRDLMPPSSGERRRRAPDRGERPEGRRDGGKEAGPETEEEGAEVAEAESPTEAAQEPSRPTPVRVAMDAPPPGDSRPADALPSRTFQARGEEWIVRITGRTVTGTRPDPGALLMQLTFYRSEEPETPARELLTVDRPLDALYSEDLEELLGRSRPAKEPFDEAEQGES